MNVWIYIAMSAYILFAVNGIIDKFLLTKVERHPVVYVFFIAVTGPLSFVLAPFGLQTLNGPDLFVALMSGIAFTFAMYFLYAAIKETSISRILPIEGGLVPLFTLIFAFVLLGERLLFVQYVAFVFLVIGAILMSFRREHGEWQSHVLKNAVFAAGLFALSFVMTKYIFTQSNFVSGMIWTRLGFFITAVVILASPHFRALVFRAPKEAGKKNILLYYGARAAGTTGGFLQNYAISLGSVTIVNALQGIQFAFLLLLTITLSYYFPRVLRERINPETVALKIVAIVLVTAGLVLLNLS